MTCLRCRLRSVTPGWGFTGRCDPCLDEARVEAEAARAVKPVDRFANALACARTHALADAILGPTARR
jgi:hypothetical protein